MILQHLFFIYKNGDDKYALIQISTDKWLLKKTVGHLIDSAPKNHQRFIRFQIDEELNSPDYNRDEWFNIFNYY